MSRPTVSLPVAGTSDRYTIDPSKIIALGLNYRDHIAESVSVKVRGLTQEEPVEPLLFPKTTNALIGPLEPIVLPRILADYVFEEPRTDHEAELALLIGRDCRDVPETEALSCVFGYTCANDVSQRNIQTGDRSGWFRGKSFDTFCPVGPVIVPAARIPDVQSLDITCRLNGRVVQSSNTRSMIFSVARIVSFVSRNFSLYEGDLILTGTPAGVSPLADGDLVEVEIGSIGVLRNPVRAA